MTPEDLYLIAEMMESPAFVGVLRSVIEIECEKFRDSMRGAVRAGDAMEAARLESALTQWESLESALRGYAKRYTGDRPRKS